MPAVPVGCVLAASRRTMPSTLASARASCPPASAPSAQTKAVTAPARAAAVAWLKPLPPGPVRYSPWSVSPARGNTGNDHTWSTLNEPITTTALIGVFRSAAEAGQHAGDRRGHQGRDGAAEHGPQAEAGEVLAAVGREPADAADLDRDRTEVGEAAQRVGGDQAALVGQHHAGVLPVHDLGQVQVGDEFVEHDLLADQATDDIGVLPRYADQPG